MIFANGTQFFCRIVGEGKPCVVLHGGPGLSHDYLWPHINLPGHSLIFYDQRNGDSGEDSIDLPTFVEDLAALRKALGHETIAVLCHSWGALLGLAYAMAHPETVSELMLISPIPLSSEEYPALLQERARRLAPHMSEVKMLQNSSKYAAKEPDFMNRYDRLILGTFCAEHKSIYHIDFRRSPEARASGDKVHEALKRKFFTKPFNLYEHLGQVACKTLIIHGTEDPHPMAAAEKIHAGIRGSRLCRMERCGHFPFVEQPIVFNQHLRGFTEFL